MGTSEAKLAYLLETKNQIKNAIESKGVEVPEGATFREFARLIEQIRGGVPVAYLYNGVQLPDINEIWTEEIQVLYPYVVMLHAKDYTGIYFENLSRKYVPTEGKVSANLYTGDKAPSYIHYEYYYGDDGFTFGYETQYGSQRLTIGSNTIWANYDILNTDGTVYLPHKCPVPVYE